MTEIKGTPGPWVVRTLENFGFNVVHYKGGDKFDIVRVAKCSDETDARRIAATPDLLGAAKSGSAWLERWAQHVGNCEGVHRCTCGLVAIAYELNAAIAKAEGAPA